MKNLIFIIIIMAAVSVIFLLRTSEQRTSLGQDSIHAFAAQKLAKPPIPTKKNRF